MYKLWMCKDHPVKLREQIQRVWRSFLFPHLVPFSHRLSSFTGITKDETLKLSNLWECCVSSDRWRPSRDYQNSRWADITSDFIKSNLTPRFIHRSRECSSLCPLGLVCWRLNMLSSLNWIVIWGFLMFLCCSHASGMFYMNGSWVTVSRQCCRRVMHSSCIAVQWDRIMQQQNSQKFSLPISKDSFQWWGIIFLPGRVWLCCDISEERLQHPHRLQALHVHLCRHRCAAF